MVLESSETVTAEPSRRFVAKTTSPTVLRDGAMAGSFDAWRGRFPDGDSSSTETDPRRSPAPPTLHYRSEVLRVSRGYFGLADPQR